jgi:hypothetical protein
LPDARLSANVPLLNVAATTFTGSTVGSRFIRLQNSSSANTSGVFISLLNDSGGDKFFNFLTSSTYSGSYMTGGPSGESANLSTAGTIPIAIGTNSTERIRIAGDGSLINLKATDVQINGTHITRVCAIEFTGSGPAINSTLGCANGGISVSGSAGSYTITHALGVGTGYTATCSAQISGSGGCHAALGSRTGTTLPVNTYTTGTGGAPSSPTVATVAIYY